MLANTLEHFNPTEQKIFKAAARIFVQRGRDGARMEDIAREAGINKALLHYYFRSKDKLYLTVFEQEIRKVMYDLFQSLNLEADIQTFLHTFIHNYIDRINQNPLLIQFMLWELRRGPRVFSELFQKTFSNLAYHPPQIIVQKIQRAVRNKEIRKVDPQHLLFNIIGMCIFTFIASPIITSFFQGLNTQHKSFINKRKDEIYNLIWNGIKP